MGLTVTCPDGRPVTFEGNRIPPDWLNKCAGVNKGPVPSSPSTTASRSMATPFSLPSSRFPGAGPSFPRSPGITDFSRSLTNFGVPEAVETLGRAGGCDYLPEGFIRDACKAGVNIFTREQQAGNGNGGTSPCPEGSVKIPGTNRCVSPGDMFPGGDPGIFRAGQQVVAGSFGMPAVTPTMEQRTYRRCPRGMRLGEDNLCYPKAVLHRRSKFRKWRPSPRPPVSAADAKALRKVDSIRSKLRDLGKKADLKVTKR